VPVFPDVPKSWKGQVVGRDNIALSGRVLKKPSGNRKHRQSGYREALLHCQSSFEVAYKPIDAAAQVRIHNYEPVSSLFFVFRTNWFDIDNFSFQAP
jgi:hypothetical protein